MPATRRSTRSSAEHTPELRAPTVVPALAVRRCGPHGWERLTVGDGAMWALPAYGDFLERRTPGTRQGMADMALHRGMVGHWSGSVRHGYGRHCPGYRCDPRSRSCLT
jgi:hypothetical protein